MDEHEVLDISLQDRRKSVPEIRRDMLPVWMKVFCFIFMLMGILSLADIPLAFLFDSSYGISMYGIDASGPLTTAGMILSTITIFKGFAAWGLWTGRDWAVDVALFDAVIGIMICFYMSFLDPYMGEIGLKGISIRLELVPLGIYFTALMNGRLQWNKLRTEHT